MTWSGGVWTIVGIVAAAISAGVCMVAWRHRRERAAMSFLGLTVTLSAWSLVYGVQLGFTSLESQLFWQRLTLAVAGFVPTAWLLFTLRYSGLDSWLSTPRLAAFLTEPVVFFLLCLTNPYHDLVWTAASQTAIFQGQVPALSFGIGYAVHITYAYTIVGVGIVRLVLFGSQISPMYQRQVGLLVGGATPPFLSHFAFTIGSSPIPHLDLTPFVFALTGLFFGLALFRFNLLNLTPIARLQALAKMGDGLVVLDNNGTIVDMIGVATPVLAGGARVGDQATAAFTESDLDDLDDVDSVDGSYRTAMVGGKRRTYQLKVSPLVDHHEDRTGTMVMVRDITGLHESEQRLEVSNRVLRHNLRNDMGVILGYAETLEAELSGVHAEHAQRIRRTAEEFLDLSEKARQISELSKRAEQTEFAVEIGPLVSELVDEFDSAHPAVTFSTELPTDAVLSGVPPDLLRIAIRNVIENAIDHNDSANPSVEVAASIDDQELRIEVEDNGQGMPNIETSVIGAGFETQLEHSQGLGLWLTYWCVTLADGTIEFTTSDSGTVVTMRIPTTYVGLET
jgi:signal transduction histidine kinase